MASSSALRCWRPLVDVPHSVEAQERLATWLTNRLRCRIGRLKPLAPSGSSAPEPASQRDVVDERRERRERRALPSLSLQQYAALCAESSVGAASSFDQALLRHGIADRDLWKAVDTSWQDRLEREPILTLRWMELTARYREHLARR